MVSLTHQALWHVNQHSQAAQAASDCLALLQSLASNVDPGVSIALASELCEVLAKMAVLCMPDSSTTAATARTGGTATRALMRASAGDKHAVSLTTAVRLLEVAHETLSHAEACSQQSHNQQVCGVLALKPTLKAAT
jgi:hypothetical protein